jgi:hypothetical protein
MMVVVVEVVGIDLARFEMARDKLTQKILAWKNHRRKAKFAWADGA